MTSKTPNKGKPRTSHPDFTGPVVPLSGMFVPVPFKEALEAEAKRQGVTLTNLRRQALSAYLVGLEGEDE